MESFVRFLFYQIPWDTLLWWLIIATLMAFVRVLESESGKRVLAALSLAMIGIVVGALTVLPAREPILRPLPVQGASALVVPLLIGFAMHGLGKIGSARGWTMSHVATWYGGAALGLGLAVGRLLALTGRS